MMARERDKSDQDDKKKVVTVKQDDKGRQEDQFRLEHFSILATIGTGTFGRVCLCKHDFSKKYFALKLMSKHHLVRLQQVEHVKSEKSILEQVRHPFLLQLLWSYQDSSFVYMLFPYVVGGELFSYLRRAGRFPSATTLFYAAEIVSALEYLHSISIIYRDLKPENLLLDKEGHLKLIDFGLAKRVTDFTWSVCGTAEYLAPEIVLAKAHNKAVDWWTLGVLVYEMLTGRPPFYHSDTLMLYQKILRGKVEWPSLSPPLETVAKDLMTRLLEPNIDQRIGNLTNGAGDVRNHRYFKSINWAAVIRRQLVPPIVPKYRFEGDTRNFEEYSESDWINVSEVTGKEERLFHGF